MRPIAPPLNKTSGMPQMSAAFNGWKSQITLVRRRQIVVNGIVSPVDTPFMFEGVIQPLSPRKIELKPEAQRSFTWLQIHVTSGPLNLDDNDRIFYGDKLFKIMGKWPYDLNGFIEYHAVEDYQC